MIYISIYIYIYVHMYIYGGQVAPLEVRDVVQHEVVLGGCVLDGHDAGEQVRAFLLLRRPTRLGLGFWGVTGLPRS